MKNYPLSVEYLREFEGGHLGYYTKGHHDKEAFIEQIVLNWSERFEVPAHYARHEWWHTVPSGEKGYYSFTRVKEGTRGAFPVTVIED